MKKLIICVLVLSLVLLVGCDKTKANDVENQTPTTNAPGNETAPSTNDTTTPSVTSPSYGDIDWETDIDVDDSFASDPVPTEAQGGETEATEPDSSVPVVSDPTEVEATDPASTEPVPSETEAPKPTESNGNANSGNGNGDNGNGGGIQLPMIPG